MKIIFKSLCLIIILSSCSGNFQPHNINDQSTDKSSPAANYETLKSEHLIVNNDEELPQSNQQVSDIADIFTSHAARLSEVDSNRKLIRTVDARFKVKNVETATYQIEDIVIKHKGFILNTTLRSSINSTQSTVISKDSTLVTKYYTITNNFIIRLPVQKLDACIRDIASLIEYLDYRIINAEDITLNLLAIKLKQNRLKKYDDRMQKAIANKNAKLSDTGKAEDDLYNKQEEADNAMIENLSLIDRVNYSTINLEIYQNEGVYREMIANPENIDEYKPGFGSEIVNALLYGWSALKQLILFLIELWPFWILCTLVYLFVIKKFYIKK